ncbi:MAG: hypothetical protein HQ556_11475 [Candidatus Marinimicrobia bacterium]|nr:hypothetical protein [Candidatus Neomarinimicrobiota bacterium]
MKRLFEEFEKNQNFEPGLKSIILAGQAKVLHLLGDCRSAHALLAEAYSLAKTVTLDKSNFSIQPLAYVCYEYAQFHTLFSAQDTALNYCYEGLQHARSQKLKLLLNYLIDLLIVKRDKLDVTPNLIGHFKAFSEKDLFVQQGLSAFNIGLVSYTKKRMDDALDYFDQAITLAEEKEYKFIKWAVQNSIGLTLYYTENAQASIDYFQEHKYQMETPYFSALISGNLGHLFFETGEYERALQYFSEGFETAQKYSIICFEPQYAQFLAEIHEYIGSDSDEIIQYHTQAVNSVNQYVEEGFPINPIWLKTYVANSKYISSLQPKPGQDGNGRRTFEFALKKDWETIKDIVRYNVILYHFLHTGIGEPSFKRLELARPTYYSMAKRMAKRGLKIPNIRAFDFDANSEVISSQLQQFIGEHSGKKWDFMLELIEKKTLEYLYQQYGYSKTKLGENLDLSYSVIIDKTRFITNLKSGD